jgi:hypothetical protein
LSLLLVFIGVMASQPGWHAAFHAKSSIHDFHEHGDTNPMDGDSSSSDEGCVIGLYASGGIVFANADAAISVPCTGLVWLAIRSTQTPFSSPDTCEPPGRAPPSVLFT